LVLQRAEQFVLSHEIGHVVLEHVAINGPEKHHRVGEYTPEQEYEADQFAVNLLLRAHKLDPLWELRSPYFAGAIMTFFVIADAVRMLQETLGLSSAQTESHPALSDRMNRAAEQLKSALPVPNLFERAEIFTGWLYTSMPEVIQWLVLINEMMLRPGPYD
jgi:Zn-dependent peptidase ImmA (M78 family)